jgi:hypothetical protein
VGSEADRRIEQMRPLAESGERGRMDVVTARPQDPGDLLPAPAAEPGRVDEHIGHRRHSRDLAHGNLRFRQGRQTAPLCPLGYPATYHAKS